MSGKFDGGEMRSGCIRGDWMQCNKPNEKSPELRRARALETGLLGLYHIHSVPSGAYTCLYSVSHHSSVMDKLNHVLSHMMASNELVLENVEMIEQVLHQRTIDQCQSDEGSGGPVMHRSVSPGPNMLQARSLALGSVEPFPGLGGSFATRRRPHDTCQLRNVPEIDRQR